VTGNRGQVRGILLWGPRLAEDRGGYGRGLIPNRGFERTFGSGPRTTEADPRARWRGSDSGCACSCAVDGGAGDGGQFLELADGVAARCVQRDEVGFLAAVFPACEPAGACSALIGGLDGPTWMSSHGPSSPHGPPSAERAQQARVARRGHRADGSNHDHDPRGTPAGRRRPHARHRGPQPVKRGQASGVK